MTGRASSSKLKRWAESIFGNGNCAYESGLEKARRKLKTFHHQGWEQIPMKKACLSYARALRLARGALLGSILDLDSAVEPAEVPQINVTTRSSRYLQHRRVSHENRYYGMRSRQQYISVLNHEILCCQNQKRKYSRGGNGVRRLSWHPSVVPTCIYFSTLFHLFRLF